MRARPKIKCFFCQRQIDIPLWVGKGALLTVAYKVILYDSSPPSLLLSFTIRGSVYWSWFVSAPLFLKLPLTAEHQKALCSIYWWPNIESRAPEETSAHYLSGSLHDFLIFRCWRGMESAAKDSRITVKTSGVYVLVCETNNNIHIVMHCGLFGVV